MDEHEIEQLAKRLGEAAEARIDPTATTRAVLRRLVAEPETRPAWWGRRAVRVAAAVVVVVAGGLGVRQVLVERPAEDLAVPAPVELRDLAATDLVDVLDSLEFYGPVADLIPATLHDLDESELRTLLQWMEG